jgi:hypothetical protein
MPERIIFQLRDERKKALIMISEQVIWQALIVRRMGNSVGAEGKQDSICFFKDAGIPGQIYEAINAAQVI